MPSWLYAAVDKQAVRLGLKGQAEPLLEHHILDVLDHYTGEGP